MKVKGREKEAQAFTLVKKEKGEKSEGALARHIRNEKGKQGHLGRKRGRTEEISCKRPMEGRKKMEE